MLCILTFSKTVDRNDLGSILNGIAEGLLSRKFLVSDSHYQAQAKKFSFPGKQDKSRSEGTWEK